MSRRSRETWEAVFGILALAVFGLAVVGVIEAARTEVSVPLLWPLAATAGCLWSGYLVVSRDIRAKRARSLQAEAERRIEGQRTVAHIINRPFGGGVPYDAQRRIGDDERNIVVSALHTHFAAGRLDQVELDERLAVALASKTIGDLAEAVNDLPSEVTGE